MGKLSFCVSSSLFFIALKSNFTKKEGTSICIVTFSVHQGSEDPIEPQFWRPESFHFLEGGLFICALLCVVSSISRCFVLFARPADFLRRFIVSFRALSYREFCRIIGDFLATLGILRRLTEYRGREKTAGTEDRKRRNG